MSQLSTKEEEFNQLPRPFKQLRLAKPKVLREATALEELPSVLIPSNDRRIPLPPLVHYGYAVAIERLDELLVQKLGFPPGMLDSNPIGVLVRLRTEVVYHAFKFQTVYLNGTDATLFIAISNNWKPSKSDCLDNVVKRLKEFLEVDEEPVWCLDTDNYYWRK